MRRIGRTGATRDGRADCQERHILQAAEAQSALGCQTIPFRQSLALRASLLTHRTGYLITTSIDGHLKIWKKQDHGIEFVKHFRTSLSSIVGLAASDDGKMCATISANGEGRVFDVVNFDMINIFKFGFKPKAVCFVHAPGAGQAMLAVSDEAGPTIRIYDARGDGVTPTYTLEKVHRAPVHLMVVSWAVRPSRRRRRGWERWAGAVGTSVQSALLAGLPSPDPQTPFTSAVHSFTLRLEVLSPGG